MGEGDIVAAVAIESADYDLARVGRPVATLKSSPRGQVQAPVGGASTTFVHWGARKPDDVFVSRRRVMKWAIGLKRVEAIWSLTAGSTT